MPQRTVQCDRCGKPAQQSFGEGGMGWYESIRCPSCGHAYEADGGPPTPYVIRQAILEEEGEWVLDAPIHPFVEVLKSLRGLLALSLPDLQLLRSRLPGEVTRGTRCEMTRLLQSVQQQVASAVLCVRPMDGESTILVK